MRDLGERGNDKNAILGEVPSSLVEEVIVRI